MTYQEPERIFVCENTQTIVPSAELEHNGPCDCDVEYVRLSAVQANPANFGVKAKARELTWGCSSTLSIIEANAGHIHYEIYPIAKCQLVVTGVRWSGTQPEYDRVTLGCFDDVESAKAAAQAYYETMIKEALE